MSKQKPQVRVVFKAYDVFKRLLSIRESPGGGLLLTNHAPGLWDPKIGFRRLKEYRFTIHPSRDSVDGVNTVHVHKVFADGTKENNHLVTTAIKRGRFQPILVRTILRPAELPVLDLPAKGKVISLPDYRTEKNTLHIAIWLCSSEDIKHFNEPSPFDYIRLGFRDFGVILAFCYSHSASSGQAQNIEYCSTTKEKQSEEHKRLGNMVGHAEGAPLEAVVGYVVRDFNRIIDTPVGSAGFVRDPPPLEPQFPNFERHPTL